MIHFGDITKLSGYELPVVDVITGGSPCQDLSVAGKRAGLAGERSGLFMKKTWSMTVGSYMVASLEQTATLMARDYKDPPLLVECWVTEKMKDGTDNGNRPGECRNNAGGGCPTLTDNHEQPIFMSDRKGHNGITEDGTATTLNSQEKERPLVGTAIVRRLTPKECERLQGMPDDWSKYGINEKGEVYELPDSARYRLQGNGIATPFWRYLLKRISAQYERAPTLGSLFDGQASFPMIWESINGSGTALWSSEIEKHAVAVAKYHFPETGE